MTNDFGSYDDVSSHNAFFLDERQITIMDMLETVDGIIIDAVQSETPEKIIHAARSLLGMSKVSGISLAKLLHGMKNVWEKLNIADVDDKTFIQEQLGVEPVTFRRYVQAWNMFDKNFVPKQLYPSILQRPMQDLVAIGSVVAQGYEPNKKQWKEIADATNSKEVRDVLREIKGTTAKKNSLTIMLEKDGTLSVITNTNGKHFIGNLVLSETDSYVAKAVDRIIKRSGIVER